MVLLICSFTGFWIKNNQWFLYKIPKIGFGVSPWPPSPMFPFGRHAPQPSPPAYSGLSAFAPPFNLGYAHSDHPYPSYPAAASSTPIPPSPCVGPYHSYYPPPPSSSGASMTSFGADFGGAGLNRWDESYYGNYGSNSAWMDHQPNLDSLMFGKGIFFFHWSFPLRLWGNLVSWNWYLGFGFVWSW